MRYQKHSVEYTVNMESLRKLEEVVPMTMPERSALHNWASKGFEIYTNPWNAVDEKGYPLNYLRAYRLEHGYSSGPWDTWKGRILNGIGTLTDIVFHLKMNFN